MPSYNEKDHPRDPLGKFRDKPGTNSLALVSLSEDTPEIREGFIFWRGSHIDLTDPSNAEMSQVELEVFKESLRIRNGETTMPPASIDMDELTDSQIATCLSGDQLGAWDEYSEHYSIRNEMEESRHRQACQKAEKIAEGTGVAVEEIEDGEAFNEMVESIFENDDTDYLSLALANTPAKLMRQQLADGDDLWESEGSDDDDEMEAIRAESVSIALEENGIDMSLQENKDAVRKLVQDGPSDWGETTTLDIVWSGDVSAAIPADTDKRLTFEQPRVALIDTGGYGASDVLLTGCISTTINASKPSLKNRVVLDSGPGPRYGLSDIGPTREEEYFSIPKVEQ